MKLKHLAFHTENPAALLRLTISAALFGAYSYSGAVYADAGDANSLQELQEIVITAEKRESTVQKTPISITAISGAELQGAGLSDMTAVAQQVPGLSFKTSGPGQTEFEMRGLTSTGGEAATVGFYLDDTALTPPGMAINGKPVVDPNLFDVNRVEVLRGPQGTLYGASSMGGTIKLITNQPDPHAFASNVEVIGSDTHGGGFNHTENLMVNLPIVQDVVALRLVGTDKSISGWIDREVLNPFPAEIAGSTVRGARGDVADAPVAANFTDSNWETLRGGRATLLVAPNDRFSITASFMHQELRQGGANTIDSPPLNEVHYQPFDVAEPFIDTFNLYSLTMKYDFGGAQLTSATAQFDRQQNQTQDISEATQNFVGGFFGPAAAWPYGANQLAPSSECPALGLTTTCYGFGAASISEHDYTRQFSQEIRLTSTGHGPLQWLVGGYFSNFGATSRVFSYFPLTNNGFNFDFGTNNLADNHRKLDRTQSALFGEGSYLFQGSWKVTVGARLYDYRSNSITSVSGVSASGTTAPLLGNASNSGVTPKLNLAYLPDADTTFYATISKGFRPGGPNSPIPVPPCGSGAPSQFAPDSIWSYELGEKLRFLNSRITVDSAVYYEEWSNVQQKVVPACGFAFTENAGKAKIYGAEFEVAMVLVPGVTLSQNLGYTHAVNSTTVPLANVVSGQHLFDVPEVTANTSLSFTAPLGNGMSFLARVTNTYVDSIQDPVDPTPGNVQGISTLPSYDIVAARTGIQADRWSAVLFVDNLTNKMALLSDTTPLSTYIPVLNRVSTNQPRTIGVDLNYRF
jgi:outer membrane receptor protein involved in Fe transport